MKLFLISILLFSLNLFAQDFPITSKGGGSYVYNVATDTNQIINGDLYFYGTFTRTQSDAGGYSPRYYIVWKYTGGSYDSIAGLRIGSSFVSKLSAPTLNTTGTYYASIIYSKGDGTKLYDRGTDSSFATPVTIIPPDSIPVQFTFTDITGADYSTVYTSNGVKLLGLDSAYAYAGGAEFRRGSLGSWVTAYTKVYGNDTLYVRLTSSAVCTTVVQVTLTVGGISDVYSVTTKLDDTPDTFIFIDVTEAEVSTQYTSNQFTLAGINCNAAISIVGGQFQINSNAWRSSPTTVANGSLVRVRRTSSANYSTAVTSVLTIGGVQDTYTITTRVDTTPVQFSFTDILNAYIDSLHYSNGVALTSFDSCNASAGLDTFKVGVNGAWFVGMKKVYNNDTIYLKNVSSGSYSTAENMTFLAGGISDTWSITTINDPTFVGTVRYVDGALTGTDNGGTSWADAWEALDQIVWSDLSGGGILYISGGIAGDTLEYHENIPRLMYSGTSDNYIRIFAGALSPSPTGHSGTVLIDGDDVRSPQFQIDPSNCSTALNYVWVKGLSFTESSGNAIYAHCNVNNIILEDLHITNFRDDGINIIGNDDYALTEGGICAEDITITNCVIESYTNNIGHEDNCIYVQMVAGLNINNTISHQRNKQIGIIYPNHEHVDPLQTHVVRDVKLYNNVMVLDSSVMGHGMILGVQSRPGRLDTVIIYNNYIYADGHLQTAGNPYINGFVTRWYGYGSSVYPPTYVIHNTVATSNGGENTILQEYGIDAFINNIVCQFGTNGQDPAIYGGMALDAFASSWNGDQCYVDSCRGNLMWNEWTDDMSFGGNQFVGSGGNPTGAPANWAEWTSASWGGTGVNDDPQFENNVKIGDVNRLDISASSPAIDIGVTEWWESWLISKGLPTTDIHGNTRNWNSPDAGAMESGTDTVPTFTFTNVQDAGLNSYHIGSAVFSNVSSTFHVWSADSFKVGALSDFDLVMIEAESGDTVFTPISASSSYSTEKANVIYAGGNSGLFSVTTEDEPAATDTIPIFSFTDISQVSVNSHQTTYAVFSGATSTFHVASADSFKIGLQGTWRKEGYQEEAESGDSVYLSKDASGSFLTSVDVTVTAGGESDIWTITTEPQPDPPAGDNWYVSNIGKGDSTGSSWVNAMYIGSLVGSLVEAGDTVYIDGGTDSLVYSGNRSLDGGAICLIKGDGTSGSRIVYTRGKDAGHNGTPIFINNGSKNPFNLAGCSYVELSYVKIICDTVVVGITSSSSNHIDLFYNEFDYTYGLAIHLNDAEHWKVMHNSITTGRDSIGLEYIQSDAFKINRGHGGEFAYNTILNLSNIHYMTGQYHRDLMQIYQMNNSNDDDTLSIHHNFLGAIYRMDNGVSVNALNVTAGGGITIIYDNIFSNYYNAVLYSIAVNTALTAKSKAYVYNNTFCNRGSSYGASATLSFSYIDSIFCKNNIIKNYANGTVIGFRPADGSGLYKDFSNNIYDLPSTYFSSVFGTFSQWQTTSGTDANSRVIGVSIVDSSSTDPNDYKYNAGSEGIDDGTTLTLFNDDYDGVIRPQADTWDIGAFEYDD